MGVYWKAIGLGLSGWTNESLRLLESLQVRKEMSYAVSIAQLHFLRQATSNIDYDAIETISSGLDMAEDYTKDAGFIIAARFAYTVGDCNDALRVCKKLLQGIAQPSTANEIEAAVIQIWCYIHIFEAFGKKTTNEVDERNKVLFSPEKVKGMLESMDLSFKNSRSSEQYDIESLMVLARAKYALMIESGSSKSDRDLRTVLNALNQVIAMYPTFTPALTDKCLLLSTAGEWDQALDTAQRLLDIATDSLDALKIIAVHAFTQEGHWDDAIQKFEDFDQALSQREPNNVPYAIETAVLFSNICCKQPRVLQICARALERLVSKKAAANSLLSNETEARILCQLGYIQTMQGSGLFEKAMKCFREASKRDESAGNIKALEGMILCQLLEGSVDDAEAQIELLTLMHGTEDLGYEFAYIQSLFMRGKRLQLLAAHAHADPKDDNTVSQAEVENLKTQYVEALDNCRNQFLKQSADSGGIGADYYLQAFATLVRKSPDFSMVLAIDYLTFMEATNTSLYSLSSTSSASGGALQDQLNSQQPGADMLVEPAQQAPPGSETGTEEISDAVAVGLKLLDRVIQECPGMTPAYVEQARCKASLGQFEDASRRLHQCLELQPQSSAVLLALAKVEIGRGKTVAADRVLNQVLSSDFSVRNVPLFKLIKAIVRAQQGQMEEALTEVEQLAAMPDFGFSLEGSHSSDAEAAASLMSNTATIVKITYAESMRLTEEDRVGVYVLYSSLLSKMRRLKEANKVLAYGKIVYAKTAQEVQILVAASQLYVEKSDFDSAIRMLDKVPADSFSYSQAQIIKANIVLNHHHDKERFTKCYQQLAEKDPTTKHLSLLGEAYLRILNPEAAIDALEKALEKDPVNSRLRGRIGRALVATHEYHRAIDFYQKTIKQASSPSDAFNYSVDLAKLYIQLRRNSSAIQVLNDILHQGPKDLVEMQQNVSTYMLLASIQLTSNQDNPDKALHLMLEAYPLQKEVVLKLRSGGASVVSSTEVVETEKSRLSDICHKIANVYIKLEEKREAEQMLQEAVQHNPASTKAMFGIAKLQFSKGEKAMALQQCKKIVLAGNEFYIDLLIEKL